MKYVRIRGRGEVEAFRAPESLFDCPIWYQNGFRIGIYPPAIPGQWVVRRSEGTVVVMNDIVFQQCFQLAVNPRRGGMFD